MLGRQAWRTVAEFTYRPSAAACCPQNRSTSVEHVFACAVFVPSAPLLVPDLVGPAACDAQPVRAAAISAVSRSVPSVERWVALGADDESWPAVAGAGEATATRCVTDVPNAGTFARFGVDVAVTLDPERDPPEAHPGAPALVRMPLSMLIAAWLRGQTGIDRLAPVVIDPGSSPADCAMIGRTIATALAATPTPVGLLVVGDGAFALSPRAPGGGLRDSAVQLQQCIETAVAEADLEALAALNPDRCRAEGVAGRVAWQTAAALVSAAVPAPGPTSVLDYADAPFGVGYLVARWSR